MSQQTLRPCFSIALLLLSTPALQGMTAVQSWRSADGAEVEVPAGKASFEQPNAAASMRETFARLDEVDWSGWKDLSGLLTDIHKRVGVPSIAAAFVRDGKIVAHATAGVRSFGSPEQVVSTDRFHLGSVTKSFTGAVIGKLVEEGKLAWDTTVGDVLHDYEMRDAYRNITVEQLLHHRGGLPAYTDGRPPGHDPSRSYLGTPTEKRAAFLADVLVQDPVGTPGRTMLYSNAGYAVAGHMAERAAELSWEQLVSRHVFDPLGMQTGGFGIPEQPFGHAGHGPEFYPVPMSAYPPMEVIAPAGNVHCSVSDLARYAIAHLAGLSGKDGFLRSETVRRLHTAPSGASERRYACGWFVARSPAGDPVHRHGGTVGASYAEIELHPARDTGTIVLTTVSQGVGEAVANQIARAMRERYGPKMSGFISAGAGQTSGNITILEGEATAEEDARLWRVIQGLSVAFNNEDRKAYHALFSPTYDGFDVGSMFDFMAQNVLPVRGGIHSFHLPSPPLLLPASKIPMRTVTFHLENGYPGYYGISLNEAGKIVEFSLFVKGDMCPNGADRQCARIVKKLDEDFR